MARYIQANCRICRREGAKLFLKGERCMSKKCAIDRRGTPPGQHGLSRKKSSEYSVQLREKQKARKAYGLLEKQFRKYYDIAERMKGAPGENMLRLLERRLDNVVYRMGIAASLKEARQLVSHCLINVNGKCINIPSYSVKVNDVIEVKNNKKNNVFFKELKGATVNPPKWLTFDSENFVGKIKDLPKREDVSLIINEQLIIELYSK